MPAEKVDGSDFFAVYEAMQRALAHCRSGAGPYTIEPLTTRFYGHFEGDPQNYRAPGEVAQQRETMDCLKRFRTRVERGQLLPLADLDAIDTAVLAEIDAAVAAARAAPAPPDSELTTDVYIRY